MPSQLFVRNVWVATVDVGTRLGFRHGAPVPHPCENRSRPYLFFHTGDERPDSRDVHLLDRHRTKLGLREERRQIEIRLEADVYGEGRNDTLEPREHGVRAPEVVEKDDAPAAAADAAHLARDGHGIRYDADEVRRVDDVERAVGEFQIGRIHLEQTDVADSLARDAVTRLLEHRI